MTDIDLSHIRGVVWDLDGTLYRYDKMFIESCNIAAAHTVLELGLNMELQEAIILAERSYVEHGSSFKLFAQHGIRYEDFHLPYHARVDTTILAKNREMKTLLESVRLPMIILTNASRDWARRTVEHLEYNDIFGDGRLLSLEDVDYQPKAHSRKGFEKALSLLGVRAEESLMVEDLARNLVQAKSMGMTTALVHHGKLPEEDVSHVDVFFDDTSDLVRVIANNCDKNYSAASSSAS